MDITIMEQRVRNILDTSFDFLLSIGYYVAKDLKHPDVYLKLYESKSSKLAVYLAAKDPMVVTIWTNNNGVWENRRLSEELELKNISFDSSRLQFIPAIVTLGDNYYSLLEDVSQYSADLTKKLIFNHFEKLNL